MEINFKNCIKCVILLFFIWFTVFTVKNIIRFNEYKELIKSSTLNIVQSDMLYAKLYGSISELLNCIKYNNSQKIDNITALEARNSIDKYKNTFNEFDKIVCKEAYNLGENLYRCYFEYNTKQYNAVIRFDYENFTILNFEG